MKLGFDISADDLVAFNLNWLENNSKIARSRYSMRAVLPILLFLLGMLIVTSSPGERSFHYIYWATAFIASVAWFILAPKMVDRIIKGRLMKNLDKPENGQLLEYREICFSPKGITVEAANESSDIKWRGILRTEETGERFFLYFSNFSGLIIPKYKITESEATELRVLFAEYVKNDNKN